MDQPRIPSASHRRRPHPARRARQVTGATSGLAALLLTGAMAVAGSGATEAAAAPEVAVATAVTTTTTTTTTSYAATSVGPAVAATPSRSALTRSHGS